MGNRLAHELANAGAPLKIADDKLTTVDSKITRSLRGTLMKVMSEPGAVPQALVIDRPGNQPLQLLISPLSGTESERTFVRQRGDLAAIYVNDPERSLDTPWERLQHMFGLFPSEAKLTAYLVAGNTVAEAGEKLV